MSAIRRREWLKVAAATTGGAIFETVHASRAEAGQAQTPAAPSPPYWTDDIGGGMAPVRRAKI